MADDDIDWDAAQNGELGQQAKLRAIMALQAEAVRRPAQTPAGAGPYGLLPDAPAQAKVGASFYGLPSLPQVVPPPSDASASASATSYDPPMDERLRTALDSVAKSSGGYLPHDLGQRTLDMFAGTPAGRAYYGGRFLGQGAQEAVPVFQEDASPTDPRRISSAAKLAAGLGLTGGSYSAPNPIGLLATRFAQGPLGHLLTDPIELKKRQLRYEAAAAPQAQAAGATEQFQDYATKNLLPRLPKSVADLIAPILYHTPRNRLPPQQ